MDDNDFDDFVVDITEQDEEDPREAERQRSKRRRTMQTPEQIEAERQRFQRRRMMQTPEQMEAERQRGQRRRATETPEQRAVCIFTSTYVQGYYKRTQHFERTLRANHWSE